MKVKDRKIVWGEMQRVTVKELVTLLLDQKVVAVTVEGADFFEIRLSDEEGKDRNKAD